VSVEWVTYVTPKLTKNTWVRTSCNTVLDMFLWNGHCEPWWSTEISSVMLFVNNMALGVCNVGWLWTSDANNCNMARPQSSHLILSTQYDKPFRAGLEWVRTMNIGITLHDEAVSSASPLSNAIISVLMNYCLLREMKKN